MPPRPVPIERGPVPAYYQIFQDLRLRIASGAVPVGGQLPTEDALMREFGVSRHTVRAAVQQLVAQGLVSRQAGRGTFVLARSAASGRWAAQSLEDMLDRNFADRLTLLRIETMPAERDAGAAAALGVLADQELFRVRWLRGSADSPQAYCRVYLAASDAARLPRDVLPRLLQTTRLLHLVERHCGVQAYRVRQVASAAAADRDSARLLRVPRGTPLLSLRRTYFERGGRPIEHSAILCRPDKYEQTVELFRMGR